MNNGDTVKEFIKHKFSTEEKREIALQMARDVSGREALEDEKKAAMSDFKSQIDGLTSQINRAATRLNNGYEHKNMEVKVRFNSMAKTIEFLCVETGKVLKSRPMKTGEKQMSLGFNKKKDGM